MDQPIITIHSTTKAKSMKKINERCTNFCLHGGVASTTAFLMFIALLLSIQSPIVTALDGNKSTWYTRYPHYPAYCSTPEEMATRKIPEMKGEGDLGASDGANNDNNNNQTSNADSNTTTSSLPKTNIVHATAILRHGARTPWGNTLNCWKDYWTNPDTGIWDCPLSAYLSPPPPDKVGEEEKDSSGATTGSGSMFLFEKRYDAMYLNSPNPLPYYSNLLEGTCQLGQLLLQGYEQELTNGKHLRQAYVYNEDDSTSHNPRMKLLKTNGNSNGTSKNDNIWDDLFYRVDDEARTLMSGQVVLRGLLGPELEAYVSTHSTYPVIPLHTADYARDVIDPNEGLCPKLQNIRERNMQTQPNTTEGDLLREFQHNVLLVPNAEEDMDAIDCLMTTMCTDRALPDEVNDYMPDGKSQPSESYGTNLFSRLFAFDVQKYTYNYKASNAEYSKLAMGPLWYEIMHHIHPHITTDVTTTKKTKLSIFSGHDTTLMPLLIALDENLWEDDADWPPYASMIVLEVHEVLDTNAQFPSHFAFRVLYNGKVLTHLISDCPSNDLGVCDIQVLVDRTAQFATLDRDCAVEEDTQAQTTTKVVDDDNNNTQNAAAILMAGAVIRTENILSTPEGMLYLTAIVSVSAMMGAVLTCCCFLRGNSLTRCLLRRRATQIPTNEELDGIQYDDDDDDIL